MNDKVRALMDEVGPKPSWWRPLARRRWVRQLDRILLDRAAADPSALRRLLDAVLGS